MESSVGGRHLRIGVIGAVLIDSLIDAAENGLGGHQYLGGDHITVILSVNEYLKACP